MLGEKKLKSESGFKFSRCSPHLLYPGFQEKMSQSEILKSNLDNCIIPFGKHKNKTFKSIFETDKKYCIWCIETVAVDRSKGQKINDNMYMFLIYIKHCFSEL